MIRAVVYWTGIEENIGRRLATARDDGDADRAAELLDALTFADVIRGRLVRERRLELAGVAS